MERYVETKLVSLSSNTATNQNNSSFKSDVEFYTKGLLVETDDIEKVEVSVVHCEIPVSFYNINYTCNQIRYRTSLRTNIYTSTIPVGNYNAYTLITALQTAMSSNISPATIAISIDKVTGCLSFQSSVSHSLTLYGFGTTANILPFLGFETSATFSVVSNLILAPFPCNLLGITRLNIISNELSTYNYSSSGGNVSYLASIPVDQPSYGLIVYENRSMTKNILQVRDIFKIDIEIRDQYYNLVNFNNADWSILFCLFITRNPEKLNQPNMLNINRPLLKTLGEAPLKSPLEEPPINPDIKDIQLLSS